MRFALLTAAAAAAAFAGGVAFAQNAAPDNPAAPAQVSADSEHLSSSALGDTSKLKAGDPGVTSNGPVPDTPANRAAYGKPLSHAGRATAPAGN